MAAAQSRSSPQTAGPRASRRDWRVLLRRLVVSIAALWLVFLSSLALSAAQSAGKTLGFHLPQLLGAAVAWAQHQSLLVQIVLIILVACITAVVFWLTVWAMRQKGSGKPGAATKYTIAPVRDLNGIIEFNLGRPSAARFPYYEKPFTQALALARGTLQAIQNSGVTAPDTLGIVVVGKADAGKTRLALKTLGESLTGWTALIWSPIYLSPSDVPPSTLYADSDLVLFIDDLQDYTSGDQALAGAGSLLRTLLTSLRRTQSEAGRKLAVVATCRSENLTAVRASLGGLVGELVLVQLPEFSPDPNNPVSAGFIADLERLGQGGGRVFPGDWNGRIGSLVLGVEVTRELYARLVEARSPAISVLCAMKLLARAGVPEHITRRIRGICAEIYGEVAIREERRVWRRALDDLESHEFVRRLHAAESDDEAVVILRVTDFDEVVTCYQDGDAGLAHDRDELLGLFGLLRDVKALYYLGNTYFGEAAYTQAVDAYNRATTLDPTNTIAWYNKGVALAKLNHYEEALFAFNQATTLDPMYAPAWYNKGVALDKRNRYEEALFAYNRATTLDPTDALAWSGKGAALAELQRDDEAVRAFDEALAHEPNEPVILRNKADVLYEHLGRYPEALEAIRRATALDSNSIYGWAILGDVERALGHTSETYAAYERALLLEATDGLGWWSRGRALAGLGRHEDALAAYDQALAEDPDDRDVLRAQGRSLRALGRDSEAEAVEAHIEAIGAS